MKARRTPEAQRTRCGATAANAAVRVATHAAACLIALLATTRAAPPDSPTGFVGWPRTTVQIRTRAGPVRFNATVADTPARQQQGLMYVRALDADESMWFPQEHPRRMQMWMKNTLIPLDILFVDARGRIACIARNAVPQSLELIGCPVAVSGVLEIGSGAAAQHALAAGDHLSLSHARQSR